MNIDTEYEKFAQEIYQGLINAEVIHTIDVKHNVNLTGKSGQEHLFKAFLSDISRKLDNYWASIRICLRKG